MEKRLYALLRTVCFLLMLAMVAIIFSQVLARYAFSDSLSWSEEAGRYIFVWMTFLGAAMAVRDRQHVSLDLVLKSLPYSLQKLLIMVSYISMLIFTAVVIYGGVKFVARGSSQISSALEIPMHYVYIVLPLGGILIFAYLIKNFYEDVFARR
ncbi:MAG: TRAP transporter small permease [Gammaproteobacteria bacterium]|uniref:TRAP transporter small permease n=1 Tax=Rhodoferax sp. TaxID=50421 RepID=UPI0017D952BC|nr:TRAP transporter small permease [Rhodoferax sp.]MBU3900139.1 TRAP transporter small permease [Gammaproteobacteria bacterium]MBA3058727.1 TRAP transporter small permease [Rhodoferax sp.]MBU3996675.1 TRAP transporter small permease [Gammaproteobacteria bacterium]MBU4018323.1 TRAP transporter small permease [Gammaproteobacteria bacterium]MBU4082177.1 TRAP transporter small permease [Gammaproteobacteria bacterium]